MARFYEIELEEKEGKAMGLHYRLRDEKELDQRFSGHYFLRTSHIDWDKSRLWSTYVLLTEVEDTFRTLKSEIGLRPNFHQRTDRVDAHAFISVLAFHLVHALRFQLKQRGMAFRWATVRRILSTQMRLTVRLEKEDGRAIYVRTTNDPTEEQSWLYRTLGLDPMPLGTIKLHP